MTQHDAPTQLTAVSMVLSLLLLSVVWLVFPMSVAWGEDEDLRSVELYNGGPGDVEVSVGRVPRPTSQTAENITVITAHEIQALNAHTLADILLTIPGVELESFRTPGTPVNIQVQGSRFSHVLVLLDNIPINNLTDNFPDVSSIPVQMIERVEIVKGADSSSWGSALGGVVNVITKSPQADRALAGELSASLGSRSTADGRAEASGTLERFGYYLYGGKLHSDGLLPNNNVDQSSFYGKLNYDLLGRGNLFLTTNYAGGRANEGQFLLPALFDGNLDTRLFLVTSGIQYSLLDRLYLEAAFKTRHSRQDFALRRDIDSVPLKTTNGEESSIGSSLNLSWLGDLHRLVAGLDYDHSKVHVTDPLRQADRLNQSADRLGIYLNDTVTLGQFAITPSVRYDHTGIGTDLFSPSFGITCALTDNTVVRGYTARGYSLVSLSRDNSTEKVWTSQVGVETSEVPYLWLKGTLFRNDTWDVATPAPGTGAPLKQRQLKRGVEFEARTVPLYFTSVSVGYTFIDARNGDSGATIGGVPKHTLQLGVKYEDSRSLRALVTGRYIDWNSDTGGGQYQAVIWDLHLGKKLPIGKRLNLEIFGSLRNIFNGQQNLSDTYHNTGRWFELGARCSF